MIEMRWIYHDMKDGEPPIGSVCVGDRLYQKLQYRFLGDKETFGESVIRSWTDWFDVPHCGLSSNVQLEWAAAP